MKTLKHIALRIVMLAIILLGTSLIYTNYLYESDLQEHSPVINTIREIPVETDILYIGESSNLTSAKGDVDKRTISEMIAGHYPSLTVRDITKVASHAGIFKSFLGAIPKEKNIKTVVVTLNLRSFGAAWIHSGLETPLQKSTVLLGDQHPIVKRFLLSFKGYDHDDEQIRDHEMKQHWKNDLLTFPSNAEFTNVADWDEAMAASGKRDAEGNLDPVTDLACHYIKAFAFQIDTLTNPRIQDFNDIIALAKEREWNLVFNLLGEDLEKANTLVGKDLVFLMEQNYALLLDYFKRRGVLIVDNYHTIEDAYFIDQDWTTEHYTEEGRKIVARNVSEAIEHLHKGAFVSTSK